ncbi:hypothetical protein HG530_003917 [Fusarium avenaceum]|nr:hypothetical protein HG530_003917 [Fusarium avenaceum]
MSAPPTSDVGFVQQGQVDWVAFGKTIVPLSIDVLARLQGAGVQPITYAGALQLTASFSLPEHGQQRLWDAINRLKCYNGASNLLYFGFGHRSFFRILTETVSGLKCIALCSCLAEMHSEIIAARILSALWHELGYPEDFEPSIPQFRALIKACGGSLASSPFPEIANRMFPSVKYLKANDRCSEPKDVAKALIGLFDISMGKTKSIAIVGGGDGAFIAAVAYWIFNMSIYVEDHDGNAIFSSSVTKRPVQPDSAQVYVKFSDLNEDHGIAISKSTYLLNDARDLIQYTPDKQHLQLRRRVPWERCLKDTFGSAVDDFMKLPEAIWKFLGSFARISLALAEGEVDVGKYFRKHVIDFAEASYGQGFIDSSQILFPELAGANLRNIMQTVLPLPFSKAQAYQKDCISRWYDDINLLGLLVEEVLILFTGTSFGGGKPLVLANKDSTSRLAVCGSGICVFIHGMVSISTRADLLRRIHVIPGRIGRKVLRNPDAVCREYDSVLEIPNWPEPTIDRLQIVPASDDRPSTPTPSGQQSSNASHSTVSKPPRGEILHQSKPNRGLENLKLTPEVLESGDAGEITFFYRISTSSGDILIPPGKITTGILESTGLVPCRKSGDCRDCVNPPKLFTVESGWFMADEQAGKPDLPHWILKNSNTKNSLLAVNNIVTLVRVVESKGILLLVSQESQLGLSSSLDALEGQRDRHVSTLGGVVRSTLPDEGSLVLVLSGDVEQGVEVGRGGEEGSGNTVGVALVADESDGLTDTRDPPRVGHQVTFPASSTVGVSRGNLSDDVAVLVVVKQVELLNELIGLSVRVVVTNTRGRNIKASILLVTNGVDGCTRGDDGKIRVGLVDGLEEHGEAVLLVRVPATGVSSKPIFVSNLDVGEAERLGVAKLSTSLTPLGGDGTSNELDLVKSVVDKRLELVLGGDVAVERKTSNYIKLTNLEVHILSPLEILHNSKAVGLLVAPDALKARTVSQRTKSILPVPPSLVGVTLEHVTTWEAQQARVHALESLGKVNSKTVLASLVGGREQADEVEVKSSISALLLVSSSHTCCFLWGAHLGVVSNSKGVVAVGSIDLGSERKRVLNPLLLCSLGLDLDATKDIAGRVGPQRGSEVALVGTLDPEGSGVLLLLHVHSPVAFVLEANLL